MLLPPQDSANPQSVLFWPPAMVVWGPGQMTELHRHHATQVVLALAGNLVLSQHAMDAPPIPCAGALVPSNAPHAIDARGVDAIIVFAEPRSDLGRALAQCAGAAKAAPLPHDLVLSARALLPPNAEPHKIRAVVPALLASLGAPLIEPQLVHPAVRRVLRHLEESHSGIDTSLSALAGLAGLSPGRFMHAFTTSVGSALRPYLLWQKLGHAARAMATGATPSAAAAEAGFADAAHLTRTFRRTFGVTPTQAQQRRLSP